MPKEAKRVPVSVRAVVQRINRRLAAEGEVLKKCRSERWRGSLGDYYVIDIGRNFVVDKHVDLEQLGRKLNALGEWETVADE